jgi:hypothetical protein
MTETVPEATGIFGHIAAWFEKHVAPDIELVKHDLAKAVGFAESQGKILTELTTVVEDLAGVIAPTAAPEVVALVGRAQAVAARAAAELEKFLGK